jgi:hypothetical protein
MNPGAIYDLYSLSSRVAWDYLQIITPLLFLVEYPTHLDRFARLSETFNDAYPLHWSRQSVIFDRPIHLHHAGNPVSRLQIPLQAIEVEVSLPDKFITREKISPKTIITYNILYHTI